MTAFQERLRKACAARKAAMLATLPVMLRNAPASYRQYYIQWYNMDLNAKLGALSEASKASSLKELSSIYSRRCLSADECHSSNAAHELYSLLGELR